MKYTIFFQVETDDPAKLFKIAPPDVDKTDFAIRNILNNPIEKELILMTQKMGFKSISSIGVMKGEAHLVKDGII